jgi:hypothetical protein
LPPAAVAALWLPGTPDGFGTEIRKASNGYQFHFTGTACGYQARNVFGSEPNDGHIFIAERSRKGSRKLLWSVMPEALKSDPSRDDFNQESLRIPHIGRASTSPEDRPRLTLDTIATRFARRR